MLRWLTARFIFGRVRKNPIRLGLLVLALVLATALWASVLQVTFSGIQSFEDTIGLSGDSYPIAIHPVGGRMDLSSFGRCLAGLESRFEMLAVRREMGVFSSKRGGETPLRIISVDSFGGRVSSAGAPSENDIYGSPVLLRQHSLGSGEEVILTLDGHQIRGRIKSLDEQNRASALPEDSALMSLSLVAVTMGTTIFDSLYFKPLATHAGPPDSSQKLCGEMNEWLSSCWGGDVPLRCETPQGKLERGQELLAAYRFNVLVMAGMTLLVCAILVAQSTSLSLLAVSRELTILRTLGVGAGSCAFLVIAEGGFVALCAAIIGVTVGHPLTVFFTQFFLNTAHEIYHVNLVAPAFGSRIGSSGLVVATIIGLGLVGAVGGSVGIRRITPQVGTRREYTLVRPWRPYVIATVFLAALGLVLAILGALVAMPHLFLAYLAVAAIVVTVVATVPFALYLAAFIPVSLIAPCLGRLAQRGVQIGGRRFLFGAMGGTVAVTLICALSLMVGSFRETLEGWAATRLQGDLFISSTLSGRANETVLSPERVAQLSKTLGIDAVIPYYEAADTLQGRSVLIAATDLAQQIRRKVYVVAAGDLRESDLLAGRAVLITESAARKLQLRVGSTITLRNRLLTVQAIIREFGSEQPIILLDQHEFLSWYPHHGAQTLTFYLQAGADPSHVRRALEQNAGAGLVVRDQPELMGVVRTLFNRTFRITEGVQWIVFAIALSGLVVATLQHLWERRREMKTMYSMGMATRDLIALITIESMIVAVVPLTLGTVGGIAMGWCLTRYLNPLSFGWTLAFSLSGRGLAGGALFSIAVIVAVGCGVALVLPQVLKRTALADE